MASARDREGEEQPAEGRAARRRRPRSADLLVWAAVLVDTAVAVIDAFTPVVLFGLLVFGPLVAAFRSPPRTTAIVAGYSVLLAIYEGIPHGFFGSPDHLVRVAAIAATGALAVWGSIQRERTARAQDRASLLARAGALLGASLSYDRTLQGVANLAVPAVADRVAIDVVEDGAVRRLAAAGAPSDAEHVAEVIDRGEPVLLADAAVLPLCARENTVGALTLGSASAPPVAGSAALEFAQELAAECATAIDNARLHRGLRMSEEALRRSSDQLGAILGSVADGVLARDRDGRVVYANAAAARLLGRPSVEALRHTGLHEVTRWLRLYDEDGDVVERADLPGARLLRGEPAHDRLLRFETVDDGCDRWVLVKARAVAGPDDELALVLLVFEDVTERRRRERRERFLAEGSRMLAGSLDYEATLRTISALVVPELADVCSVDVATPGGQIRNVATTYADPDRMPDAGAPRDPPPFAATAIGEVLRTGDPQLYPTAAAPGVTSAMVVPLIARGRTLGTLTLATDGSRATFDADDLALAEELARRCALAVDNARLYGERSHVARTLQGSLVPAQLPRVPGFEVAARFHAAGEDIQVGGDFFDVFETDDSSWAAVIGDVSGKGADAAAITALARYTVRAVAVHGRRPSTVLRELNDALVRHDLDDRFCTAAFARLRGGEHGARVQISSGGHPLPVLITVDGEARTVGRPGTALGIGPGPRLFDREVVLQPGDKLVFVTDGVIEAQVGGGLLGADGLERLLTDAGSLDAVATCERIEAAILGDAEPRDDIAVLVLRATGVGLAHRGREGLARAGSLGRESALNLRLPGGPRAPAVVRAAVEGLPAGTFDASLAHTARLLASEIVTNSVVHGGTGEDDWIDVDVVLSPAGLRVDVTDHGPGFAGAARRPDPDDPGGRGLFLVDSLADRWGSAAGGTRVWFEVDRPARTELA